MPFKSKAQQKWMFANHPRMARRWARHTPDDAVLPARVRKQAAEDGGDGGQDGDIPFEQSFSNIAHAYIQDRAPGLEEYEIGFQVVDRDEENNKAVGIFGFKVGSQWLYAPVFFVDGDLKGHELLYIKGQDQFVPLKENWINHLLAKKPMNLGEGVGRNTRDLGVHYPDLSRALQAPHKYATAWAPGERAAVDAAAARLRTRLGAKQAAALAGLAPWAQLAVAELATAAARPVVAAPPLLPGLLKDAGVAAAAGLAAHLADYPALRAAFDAFYEPAAIRGALKAAHGPGCTPPPRRRGRGGSVLAGRAADRRAKVAVYRGAGLAGPDSVLLDDADRATLFRTGLLIKDARADDEVSRAYAVDVAVQFERTFRNPDETGLYDVLTADGSVEKMLVVLGPLGPARSLPWCTVVRLDGRRRAWLNVHPSYVWVAKQYRGWADWYDDLPAADAVADDAHYLVLGPGGQGSVPFAVRDDRGDDAGGGRAYDVTFDTHARLERAASRTGVHGTPYYYDSKIDSYDAWRDGARIHLGQRTGTRFRSTKGDLYVPAGYKLVRLAPDADAPAAAEADAAPEGKAEPDKDGETPDFGQLESRPAPGLCGDSDPGPPIDLGDALDVDLGIHKRADVNPLALLLATSGMGAGLGTALGGVAGTGAGAARGNIPAGLGRGLIRGGATGLGAGAGSGLGRLLGGAVGGEIGRGVGDLAGTALGGTAGWIGGGKLLGPPGDRPALATDGDEDEDDTKAAAVTLGDAHTVERLVHAGTAPLTLSADGATVAVNGRPLAKAAALEHLVCDHGLRVDDATTLLDAATRSSRGLRHAVPFRIKYADGYGDHQHRGDPYLTAGGPFGAVPVEAQQATDSYMGSTYPAYQGYEQLQAIPDLHPGVGNRDAYDPATPDPQAMQVAQEAARTGQRELFDTSMVGSLLKGTQDDQLVDKYLKDLMKGLDRLGRLLFSFYYHRERFAERYGADDVPELEDSLRHTFQDLGDVVLFLKQKTVDASPDESAQAIDLAAIAGR